MIAAVAIPDRPVPHSRSQRFAPLGRLWFWLDSFGAAVARELGVARRLVSPSFRVVLDRTRTGRAPRTTPGVQVLSIRI